MNRSLHTSQIWKTALLVASLVALTACSKVTRENYDKLKMGMEYQEVVTLLGEPQSCESVLTAKSCTWGEPPKTVTIKLIGDKVVLFSNTGL